MGKYLPGGSEQKHPSRPLPRAVATAAVDPPPRARSSDHPEPSRAWIRCPTRFSLPSLSSLSLSRSVSTANPNPNTTVSVLAIDPPLPELQHAIVKSPPPEASPRSPLHPRRRTLPGELDIAGILRFTATTPPGVRRRSRCQQPSPCLAVTAIVTAVSLRTIPCPFPFRLLFVASPWSIFP